MESFNLNLCGILLYLASNVLYCFENIRSRIYFLFFNITFFGFYISRPLINMIKDKNWWYFGNEATSFSLNSMMLSLVCLFLGHYLVDKISNNSNLNSYENPKFNYNLKLISHVLFYISFIFYFYSEIEKIIFMRSHNYAELYSEFKSSLPSYFNFIGSMCKYFLCIYLSTLPSKFSSSICLSLYVLSAIPSFLIGARNGIVLNTIFAFLYFFTRDSIDDKLDKNTKWIGKFEKNCMILLSPIFIFILGAWNYLRDGTDSKLGILRTFIDLFEKQGVSFDVLCLGYLLYPKFQSPGINYTFGGIIDYFLHGKFSQIFFGTEAISDVHQSIQHVLYGNNFAHKLSYAVSATNFLNGHGFGSSYILETYADFGYIGVILISLTLGMFFASIINFISKGPLYTSVVLSSLMYIYFSARSSALRWIEFVIYIQFIIPVVLCYTLAKLCIKEYSYHKKI